MTNIKINKDREEFSDKEIKDAQNFKDVMNRFNAAKPFYQKPGFMVGGIATIAVIIGLTFLLPPSSNKTNSNENEETSTLIQPPIDGVDIPLTDFEVVAEDGAKLEYASGSILNIPANAFLDSEGNVVSGEVVLKYREFHNPAAFFISGIPMTYDSAGVAYQFESGGMLEMRAYQNGEELFTNPDNPIVVDLASLQTGDYFNIYQLDENNGWKFIEKDTAGFAPVAGTTGNSIADPTGELDILENELFAIQQQLPDKPKQADPNGITLNINFKKKQFPELTVFKDVLFEIVDPTTFEDEYGDRDWDDVEVKAGDNDTYLLIFYDDHQPYEFITQPVYKGQSYNDAIADYNEMLVDYNAKYDAKMQDIEQRQEELIEQYGYLSDSVAVENRIWASNNMNSSEIVESQNLVFRSFTVREFGVWNCDCPIKLPKGQMVFPIFVNKDNKLDTLSFGNVYLAETGRNAMFTLFDYYVTGGFEFDPGAENLLWFVTSDNHLAVFYPEDFEKLPGNSDTLTLSMTVTPQKITDPLQVEQYLKL